MHGAGLNHAFFMRRHAALVEIRPFDFDGPWPNQYFRDQIQHAGDPIFHIAIGIGAPELCRPRPTLDVKPLAARDSACALPWETLERAIGHMCWWRKNPERYPTSPTTPSLPGRTLMALPTASTPGVGARAGTYVSELRRWG